MSDVHTGFIRTDDGLQLHYRSIGTGPLLVCCNGVGVSTFFWKYIVQHFRDRFRVVLWDYRGHGLSGLPPDLHTADLSVKRSATDLRCIIDHLQQDDAPAPILAGHSMGVQVIIEYVNRWPDTVRALIPLFGTYRRPLDTFFGTPWSYTAFRVLFRLAAIGGKTGLRLLLPVYSSPLSFEVGRTAGLFDRYWASRHDMDKYMEHLVHMNPQLFLRMVESIADHDLTDALPHIQIPALVIAAEYDLFTPVHCSRTLADLLPQSEFMVLAEASHAAIIEQPETINLRIDRFFREHLESVTSPGAPKTPVS